MTKDAGASKEEIKQAKKSNDPKAALIQLLSAKNQESSNSSSKQAADDEEFLAEWPYATDYGDHFETPKCAYRDVKPVLRVIARNIGVTPAALCLYDPYYCRGHAAAALQSLGFEKLINRKRDFYADIASRCIPDHHVLLTNPPYSADHKEKLLAYILDVQRETPKPFLLLLPAWTAAKASWRQFLWHLARIRAGQKDTSTRQLPASVLSTELELKAGVFYICPGEKYEFLAAGTARDTAPFFGIWFCGGLGPQDQGGDCTAGIEQACAAVGRVQDLRAAKKEGYLPTLVLKSLSELRNAGLVRTVEQDRERQQANPVQRVRREKAIKKLDEKRKADPAHKALKRKRENTQREVHASRYCPLGEEVPAEIMERVRANKRACTHFFGGLKGCTMRDKCRFAHAV